MFAERCERCNSEYIRDFEMPSVGFKRTGRACTAPGCKGQLRDQARCLFALRQPGQVVRISSPDNASHPERACRRASPCALSPTQITDTLSAPERTHYGHSYGYTQVLDWEDALPEDELDLAEKHSKEADLNITLARCDFRLRFPARFLEFASPHCCLRVCGDGFACCISLALLARPRPVPGACLGLLSPLLLRLGSFSPPTSALHPSPPPSLPSLSPPKILPQGTSLQITPACNLPLKNLNARRRGGKGKLAIVNLQVR